MFQLHSGDYAAMIEAYQKLRNVLEEERENLQLILDNSRQAMSGAAINCWQYGYDNMLNYGVYEELIEQLDGMQSVMRDLQPLMNQMIEEGKLFAEQLESDVILNPSVRGSVENSDTVLLLEDEYANLISGECERILELGEDLNISMNTVFSHCGDLIELSYEKSQLENAYTHVKRVENLQTGFNRYVAGVRNLDEGLLVGFEKFRDASVIQKGIPLEINLKKAAGQGKISKLQAILKKDPTEWTQAECEMLARTWENAVTEGNIDTMETILNGCVDHENNRMDYFSLGSIWENCNGEPRWILESLMQNQLPPWKYAECMAEVREEEGVLTVFIMQDVLLEEDNTIRLTLGDLESGCGGMQEVNILSRTKSYSDDYYKIAESFLKQDAEGIYPFETLLRQGTEEVSEREKKILALLYEDQCRAIETAPDTEARKQQFAAAEKFVESLFYYQTRSLEGRTEINLYTDQVWCRTLQGYLSDPGSFAFQMLETLGEYSRKEERGWIDFKATVGATITPQVVGLTLQVNFMQTDLRCPPTRDTQYVSSQVRALQYAAAMEEDLTENLYTLGYTKNDIAVMFSMADSVEDALFIKNMLEEDYQQAFQTKPELLSDQAGFFLAFYMVNYLQFSEPDGSCPELEEILNQMIGQRATAEEYLELLAVGSGSYRTLCEFYLMLGEEYLQNGMQGTTESPMLRNGFTDNDFAFEEERLRKIASFNVLMTALYSAFADKTVFEEKFTTKSYYEGGGAYLELSGLSVTPRDDLCVSFALMDTPTRQALNITEIKTDMLWDSIQTSINGNLERLDKLHKKMEKATAKMGVDVTLSLLGFVFPKTAAAVQALADTGWSIVEGSTSGAVKGITNEALLGQYMTKGAKGGTKVITSVLGGMEKLESIQLQIDDISRQEWVKWFCSGNQYQLNGEPVYLGEQVSNYKVIQAIQDWNAYGCGVFLKDAIKEVEGVEIDPTNIPDVNDAIADAIADSNLSAEESEVVHFLIYGNSNPEAAYRSILEIDPEDFIKGTEKIREIFKEEFRNDETVITAWQEYIKQIGEQRE